MEHIERRIAMSETQGTPRNFSLYSEVILHSTWFPTALHFFSAWDRSNILLVPASDTNVTREEKPLSYGFRDTIWFDTKFSRKNIYVAHQLSKIIQL